MAITFENIIIGNVYERTYLAKLWGYKSFQALSKGVITPTGTSQIVLFVTREKQEALTQYNDFIDGNKLFWEGEKGHGTDRRICDANKKEDEIHLFYREIHHSPFTYYGKIHLEKAVLKSDSPSEFIFDIIGHTEQNSTADDILSIPDRITETERKSLIDCRVGQGSFRKNVIRIWGKCSVTENRFLKILRASHIKPWKDCNNEERMDGYNGLLLTPNFDAAFDIGLISFDPLGKILISYSLSEHDRISLGIKDTMKLYKIPDKTKDYLEYHRKIIFQK